MRTLDQRNTNYCYTTTNHHAIGLRYVKEGKGSPYSITERRVTELIPVLGSQPVGDVSHKPDGRLPLLSARPAVTLLPCSLDSASDDCCAQ